MTKVTVIIPAYNEGATIESVVRGALQYCDEVIVVDDASNDATGSIAQKAGAHVVRQTFNKGYDSNIDDGMREALARGAEILVTMDADGQHRPADIPLLVAPVEKGEADIVAGQRPFTTHPAEKVFALYTKGRFGIGDPLCGFKAYSRHMYEMFGPFDTLQSIGSEMMLRARVAGKRVTLVPIHLADRTDTSRFYHSSLRGNLKILRALYRVLVSL